MRLRAALALAGAAGLWLEARPAEAAGCAREALQVRVEVVSAPLSVNTDLSQAELRSLATVPGRHPPLGYYLDKVGYRLAVRVAPPSRQSCPAIAIAAQLVQARQEIQLARELRDDPCRFRAAERHYRRHAAAARAALGDAAMKLPALLRSAAGDAVASRPDVDGLEARIESRSRAVLDRAVTEFADDGDRLRDQADSPAEISALDVSCGSQ